MARARNIKPSFFTNDTLAECDPLARLLFIGLWTLADREGRLEDRSKKIKAEVVPYDNCDCEKLLSQLSKGKFIIRYKTENNNYIQIVNFSKHQNPHIKEQASTIPAPDMHQTCMEVAGPLTDSLLLIPDSPSLIPSTKKSRVSLEQLSVEHIREWLSKKRSEGRYQQHDEHFILEYFRNYCQSKGKTYVDYPSALRNAFEWKSCQPANQQGQPDQPISKSKWTSAAEQIIAEDRAARK